MAIIPTRQIPVVPIIRVNEAPYALAADLLKYDWLLRPVLVYSHESQIAATFDAMILDRVWAKHQELSKRRAAELGTVAIDQYLKLPF